MPDILASLLDYGPMIAALAAAGIAAGFLSGLFGIGGGSVLVPVLYTAMAAAGVPEDIRMQVTLGTLLRRHRPDRLPLLTAPSAPEMPSTWWP